MRNPQDPNWRGQRPKFNPNDVPETKNLTHIQAVFTMNKTVMRETNIVDPDAKKRVFKQDGTEITSMVNRFDRSCPPRVAAEIRRQEMEFEHTDEYKSALLAARLRSLLKRGGV